MAIDIAATFLKHEDDEFLEFDRIKNKFNNRPDIHAFLLLDSLAPRNCDMVCSAEHDEIWLSPSIDDLDLAGITEGQVVDLIRCGVRYDRESDSLAMYV